MREKMLAYLQDQMNDWLKEREQFGDDDRIVIKKMHDLIACKEMVEVMIEEPVNLNRNGTITVGL